jgi:membrane fusion protein, multidrug efflux system
MQHLNPKFRALATPALAVIFALTLAACGPDGNSQAAEAEDEKEEAVSSVRAEIPRQDRVSANHRATATLQAISDARVISRATGLVRELHVEEGDRVEEGQVLAMIDDARLRLEVERAVAAQSLGGYPIALVYYSQCKTGVSSELRISTY